MTGAVVCSVHGGQAPQVRQAAARRVAEAQAFAVYEKYSPNGHQPRTIDVLAELEKLTSEIVTFKDWASGRISALSIGEWQSHNPRVDAQVALFERALDRTARLLTELARLGLVESQLADHRAAEERGMQERVGMAVYIASLDLFGNTAFLSTKNRSAQTSPAIWKPPRRG